MHEGDIERAVRSKAWPWLRVVFASAYQALRRMLFEAECAFSVPL